MDKKLVKTLSWVLLLAGVATLASGCYWWGPRRHWRAGWRDGGGWHEGGYYR